MGLLLRQPADGLANRWLFMDRVEHGMEAATAGWAPAVLFCDLDGSGRVNHPPGHAAGTPPRRGRQRIIQSVRHRHGIRLGGDEFAVLLEDVTDPDQVTVACQRILMALRSRFQVFGEDVSVTTTIGVAMSETGESADALLSQADLAMYHGKSQGKNRFESYRLSFGDERLQRIELVETLRTAIETRELDVVYQPLVDLRSHEILGVEALVRWTHDGSAVAPDCYIPTAGTLAMKWSRRLCPRPVTRRAAPSPLPVGRCRSAWRVRPAAQILWVRVRVLRARRARVKWTSSRGDRAQLHPQRPAPPASMAAPRDATSVRDRAFSVGSRP
jgi:diguanylate cyclase (GGDEF)-like protein